MYKDRAKAIYGQLKDKRVSMFNAPLFKVDTWRTPLGYYMPNESEIILTFADNGKYWEYTFYSDFADDIDNEFAYNKEDYEKVLTEMGVDSLFSFIENILK